MNVLMCCVVAGLALASAAQAEAPPPAEAYGRLPGIADAAISPDGTKVVVAVSNPQGDQAFEVLDAETGASIYAARVANARRENEKQALRDVDWADDRHILFTISVTLPSSVIPYLAPGWERIDYWRAGIADIDRKELYLVTAGRADSTPWSAFSLTSVVAPIDGDPGYGRLVARSGPYSTDALSVYRVDLATGLSAVRARGAANSIDFLLNRSGEAIVRFDTIARTNDWRALDITQRPPRVIAEGVSEIGAPPDVVAFFPDGRLGGVDRINERGRYVLFAMDPATGVQSVVFESPPYDVGRAIIDPWTHEIVGAEVEEIAAPQHFLEPDLADASARLRALDRNAIVRFLSWSRDRTKFVAYIERPTDAGGYYVFEPASNRLRLLGMRYRDLNAASLGLQQEINYPARDGVRIPAYLTLPNGRPARNLPLVVLVHGGPTSRDGLGFDWWASFLASRGYLVAQPNFRGSGGYGYEWERAGYREWGALMQSDVEDVVVALVRAGMADPARVCIVGGSYGGYAALAGATLTPERYKCAASIAGVSDLPMMLAKNELRRGRYSMSSDWWTMLIGDRREDRAHLEAVSPAFQAAHATAPILLIHGANDIVVPIEQSRRMAERLRAAGKDVRLVEMPSEDHWLSDAPTRIQMLRELETFLAANLGSQ